jgi:hypothetical protein
MGEGYALVIRRAQIGTVRPTRLELERLLCSIAWNVDERFYKLFYLYVSYTSMMDASILSFFLSVHPLAT